MNDPGTDSAAAPQSERGSSILDILVMLARHKKLVFVLPVASGFVAMVIALLLPNWYTATTKIMPPQQTQSNAVAMLGQLGAIAGGAASQALGLKNPSDVYVAMLKSRTIADALIQRFDLKSVYDEKYLVETRKELLRHSAIAAGREGVITIEVEDQDPKRASSIANAYVEELRNRTLNLAVTEAGQRRLFFEGQFKKAKIDLVNAELELKKFTQESGLVNPQGQVGLSVAAAASLRALISAKEIQIAAMRTFATENNPELKRTLEELAGLRAELAKLEKDPNVGKGDVMVPFGKAPEIGLEYTRRFRDLRYYETLFEVLAKQYEIARIDEAKDATLIQVLDIAVEPEKKSRPRLWLFVSTAALLGLLTSIVWVFATHSFQRARKNPSVANRLEELKSFFVKH